MPTAYAHTNIALIKYWGKRGAPALNLPAVGSLSLTLDKLGTETRVELTDGEDAITSMDGAPLDGDFTRALAFVQGIRARAGRSERCVISTRNDVPTAAGLASSASAFAALALAATRAYGVTLEDLALSQLARMGSGSAARSVFGGFVRLHKGERDDGADCYAAPLSSSLDVRLVVVRCAEGKKAVPSTAGMDLSMKTSPMWRAWTDTHEADLAEAERALATADLEKLGDVMEHNTLKMHATTFTAQPGFWYWNPTTLAVMTEVRLLKARGTGAWLTMDAGPHVKVLCAPSDAAHVKDALAAVPGVIGADVCAPGPAAKLLA
jgi:diphosphomevalonate decarboxylase